MKHNIDIIPDHHFLVADAAKSAERIFSEVIFCNDVPPNVQPFITSCGSKY